MKPTLLVLFLFLFTGVFAQKAADSVLIDVSDFETEDARLALPFAALKIMDVRFDRSNVGCVNKTVSLGSFKYRKVPAVFPDSLHAYLPKVVEKLVDWKGESADTLVVLVKQFRITDYLLNGINMQYEPALLLKFSASFFRQQNNQLVKLFSVDDLYSKKWPNDRKIRKEMMTDSRKEALVAILHNVFENRNWTTAGSTFPVPVVLEGIGKRFALPLLNDTVLVPGVYRSFKEFKANKPSLQNVKLGMRRNALTEIRDSAGKLLDLKNFWGACDGRKRYIVFRGELCELVPSDKSFRFLSYTQTSDLAGQPGFGDYAPQTGIVPALLIKAMDNTVNREFFYLNMDEEEVHLEEIFGKSNLKRLQKDLLK